MNKCPICNGENNCGILNKKESCWCMNLTVPEKVLALSGSNKDRCICLACIRLGSNDKFEEVRQ